jgi:zinc protease
MTRALTARGLTALALALALALSTSAAAAQEKKAEPQKVTSIEGITEYKLPNGFRILLFPDPSSSKVTVNCTVFVGSRHEGYGETGMAHLLEHMVFKGTPTHPDVPKALKERGAEFNGTTWLDRTNYFESMQATDDNLEFGIKLEADRMMSSYVKREDLLSEFSVVRSEFERGENSPERVLSQRMNAVAYEWHNYGKSTIGNKTDIERVPIDKLQAFYKKYYRPDNAMLIVAGKFDEKKALEFASKYFGALKNPKTPLEATYTEEPPQDGEREVILRRVGEVGVVGAVYHICAGAHADFPAMEILDFVLTSPPSGRLYKALVEAKLASSVSGFATGLHDPGTFEVTATVSKGKTVDEVRKVMIDVLEGLAKTPVTKEEVERAQRQLLKDRELAMTNSNRIGITLSEWAASGDWRLFFLHRDRLEKVTPSDVNKVAARYLKQNNRTVGVFMPQKAAEYAAIPATPKLEELLKDYKGREAIAAGESFDPTPKNIEGRVRRADLGGDAKNLKLALMPKKTRGGVVQVDLNLHYGSEKSLAGNTSASQFIGPIMMRGTKNRNRQQIQDDLDKLGARVNIGGLIGDLSVGIECKRDKLPEVMKLVGELLREPAFPADEFEILKRQLKERIEKMRPEPNFRGDRELRRKLAPYPPEDVRYTPTLDESLERLEKVTIDDVKKLYTEQLGGQNGELSAVGDFDPQELTALAAKFLADWKAKTPYEYISRPANVKIEGGKQTIETPGKANSVYLAAHSLAMKDTDPDYPALTIGNFLFGGGTLSSRLGNRVRQKEGLSYGVASQFSADARDPSARFFMFAICNPTNMEKVDKVIAEELDKLLKDGVTETELAEAKKSYLARQQTSRGNDSSLASLLADGLFNNRTFDYYAEQEKRVSELTVDEVNKAIRKYWSPKKLVIIHAGDFKKKSRE